jgi:tetratricopeptide (TPR) repeat protein
VREARLAAGLSLAQLATGRISPTAIHLIESGQTRPTLPTLLLIAERTGRPLESFLESGEQVLASEQAIYVEAQDFSEIELALEQERFEDALSLLEQELPQASGAARARAVLYAAQANVRLAQPEKAKPLVAEALTYYVRHKDRWMVAECLDWQAATQHLHQDPDALRTAERALKICEGLDPMPIRTYVRILGRIGAICVAHHRWPAAIRAYEAAVGAAGALHDLSRLGKMYNDLSIVYRRMDRLSEARRYARRAVHVHEMLNDRLSVGRAETNLALVLARLEQLSGASVHLERALSIFEQENVERGRSHILLAMAEVHLKRGQLDIALESARAAYDLAQRVDERLSLAEASELLGRIAGMEGDGPECDRHFRLALSILNDLAIPERLMSCRAAYARALEARGDTAGALEQWKCAVTAVHPELVSDPGPMVPSIPVRIAER